MSSIAQQVAASTTEELESALMSGLDFPDEIIFAIVDELGQRYYALMLAEDFSDEEFYEEDYYSADQDMWGDADFWDEPFSDF